MFLAGLLSGHVVTAVVNATPLIFCSLASQYLTPWTPAQLQDGDIGGESMRRKALMLAAFAFILAFLLVIGYFFWAEQMQHHAVSKPWPQRPGSGTVQSVSDVSRASKYARRVPKGTSTIMPAVYATVRTTNSSYQDGQGKAYIMTRGGRSTQRLLHVLQGDKKAVCSPARARMDEVQAPA